jgi:hypothetical protein
MEVTQLPAVSRLGDPQTVRPLRVWAPKSATALESSDTAGRNAPSLWDALKEE